MQPSLFDTEEYTPDIIKVGHSSPLIRHPDHSVRAMSRPFITWDGEGYTDEYGFHHYWLLANSVGDKIMAPPGRSLERWNVARAFHSVQARIPDAIHVGFALGYDYTMLLRGNSIDSRAYKSLQESNIARLDGYVWRVMMGKQLTSYLDSMSNAPRFNLQDTWGFFQRSFVKALDEYFGNDWPYRDIIVEMKNKRATFTRDEDEQVIKYNDMELELLVILMEELRDRLFQSGMPVSRWYGPGAIANGLLQRWNIKSTIVDLYKEKPNLAAVAQHAYAGGRFELVKAGHVNGKVYQYDVNSAYPYALSKVPDLKDGEWKHVTSNIDIQSLPEFSVCRVRWSTNLMSDRHEYNSDSLLELYPRSIPFPFWRRTPDGNIHYPSEGIHGWYWLPEVKAALAYGNSLPDSFGVKLEIEEAYGYYPNKSESPYNTIPLLYRTRQKLKAAGNGSHIGIKLGLNSLYGKFAQQIGYDNKTKRIPTYHNLAIAGYVTSVCRGMMIEAMTLNPTAIIAFETDGVFSSEPLPLDIGIGLGQWEETVYDDMYYYQSGFRFGIRAGQSDKAATRGIPAKDIDLERMQREITDALSTVRVDQTQFITLGQAYAWNKPELAGQWKKAPKVLQVMLENIDGKRVHDPDCFMCDADSDGNRHYRWDSTHLSIPKRGYEGQLSSPHKVLWSNLVPEQELLEDYLQEVLIEP